ncbi:MAG TPA: M48 family metallopeptidase [Steroidobacteraceae bacterium]|nr:M48 family metallopeptidase [Steroidobacteraceae bacterium]
MLVRRLSLVLLAVLLTSITACETVQTTQSGVVGVNRKQRMLVSEEEVEKGAETAYAQEKQKAKQEGKLNASSELTSRVRNVSQRLIPGTGVFRSDAPNWNWEVNTLTTKELNAYCMPGGKIMVYSGLVDQLKLSDAELAAVIGHEMAHALREHSRERISRLYAQQIALAGVAVVTGAGEGAMGLANQVASVTFQLPHSREQESEADTIGLELMARAGYDPNAAVSVWKKMIAANQGGTPQFLSTHPSPQTRIADLQALVPKVMPLYEKAKS